MSKKWGPLTEKNMEEKYIEIKGVNTCEYVHTPASWAISTIHLKKGRGHATLQMRYCTVAGNKKLWHPSDGLMAGKQRMFQLPIPHKK